MFKIKKLFHSYQEGYRNRPILQGLDLSVEAGESIALLGRSGCGKSTLLNMLAGIDQPDSGEILINGQDITQLPDRERTLLRRRQIGFVYQFFNLIPTLTVAENIALPLELNRATEQSIAERLDDLLERIGLSTRRDAFPDQLSGGEQQRVAMARALAHRPPLVLADEPTGNLDLESGKQVLELLFGLSAEQNQTLLLVTHSLEVARRADRIVTLENGILTTEKNQLAW